MLSLQKHMGEGDTTASGIECGAGETLAGDGIRSRDVDGGVVDDMRAKIRICLSIEEKLKILIGLNFPDGEGEIELALRKKSLGIVAESVCIGGGRNGFITIEVMTAMEQFVHTTVVYAEGLIDAAHKIDEKIIADDGIEQGFIAIHVGQGECALMQIEAKDDPADVRKSDVFFKCDRAVGGSGNLRGDGVDVGEKSGRGEEHGEPP